MTTDPTAATRRLATPVLATLAAAALTLLLAACETPPHKADTNATKYNYSYNK